jgi:hypothetical protein
MTEGSGTYVPSVGEYVRIRNSDWAGESSLEVMEEFTDRGIVISVDEDEAGVTVRYLSGARGRSVQGVPVARVSPDPWGAVRRGWASVTALVDDQNFAVRAIVVAALLSVNAGILWGAWIASKSIALYRVGAAAWGEVKFGLIGGIGAFIIVGLLVLLVERIRGHELAPPSPRAGFGGSWASIMVMVIVVVIAGYGAWQGWINATVSTSITEIEANRQKYDGEGVHIVGRIVGYGQHVSRIGNQYVTAALCDENKCIQVFEWGVIDSSVAVTGWAEVWGTYQVESRVGEFRLENDIDARHIASIEDPSTSDNAP